MKHRYTIHSPNKKVGTIVTLKKTNLGKIDYQTGFHNC